MSDADTIFAAATGPAMAALTVLRVSGADTRMLVTSLAGTLPTPRRASLRPLRDASGEVLDRALVLWMPGPASYTGQDCAEFSLHGGHAVLDGVSRALIHLGARPALPGEFTRRAFLAGRMDLLEAEAIGDLVAAETDQQRRQALRQMEGAQSALLADWRERLLGLLAFQEALIDFPDEDLPDETQAALARGIEALAGEVAAHIGWTAKAARLREGLVFAIVGPPNAGKSSLINALAGRDLAMVSALPGTTRDALEAVVALGGVRVTLVDTAGLREAADALEAEGIRRALSRAASADLVLHVVEAGAPPPVPVEAACETLTVVNKIDLADQPPGALGISVLHGTGMAALGEALAARARALAQMSAEPVLSRARHEASLRHAHAGLVAAGLESLPELRGEALRLAMRALGRITGEADAEAVLDVVFGAFCIGK